MEKYLVTIHQDDIEDITCEKDDPTYDGCESNIEDPEGVYHITAESEEDAIETAKFLDSMGNPSYCEGVLDEEY